ncbi:MAG: BBE domain-containing protein [Bryobacteraceae bacterium]
MSPWSAGSAYANAFSDDDRTRFGEAYGSNYERLSKIKAKYDATNRFLHNTNIQPKDVPAPLVL